MSIKETASAGTAQVARICKVLTDFATRRVVFKFSDGQQLTLDYDKLHENIRMQCALVGAREKVRDSYSSNEGVKDAFVKANACLGNLHNGLWVGRTGVSSSLAAAYERVKGCTEEEAIEFVNNLTPEKKKALSAVPRMKVAMATIALERAEKAASDAPDMDDDDWDNI